MANIMSMKQIRNKPSRNGFDLSFKKNFTAKAGELLPVMVREVIPGDKFTINLKTFTRTQPVNTAAFARVREYYDFFFVPYHLLWNRANEVLSQMDYNQQHATSLGEMPNPFSGELPYVTSNQIVTYLRAVSSAGANYQSNYFGYHRADLSAKLLEYLGYGNFDECYAPQNAKNPLYNVDMNIFGLLAYQKIYSDYYRDQQWEKPNPSTFNCDYMSGSATMNVDLSSNQADMLANYNLFDLRYCNWQKDLYHGLLPAAQYGDTAVVPLGGSDELFSSGVSGLANFSNKAYGYTLDKAATQGSNYPVYAANQFGNGGNMRVQVGDSPVPNTDPLMMVNMGNLGVDIDKAQLNAAVSPSASSGLSILALRQYEFLQKWKEIAQCGDQDYKGITKRIWNVDVPEGLSDKCRWLGGVSSSLDINEVVNTNITGTNGADIAGKGIGASQGTINFTSDGQYGVLMCIYHAMPLVDYTVDYLNPEFLRVNAEDFANPVFDRVGMQQVTSVSVLQEQVATGAGASPQVLGYAPRYVDYKTSIDLSVGAFKRDMSHWVISYNQTDMNDALDLSGVGTPFNPPSEGSAPANMNYTFFKVNPNTLDPIFATAVDSTVDTDQLLCSSFFDVKAVRNLDVDGLPY